LSSHSLKNWWKISLQCRRRSTHLSVLQRAARNLHRKIFH